MSAYIFNCRFLHFLLAKNITALFQAEKKDFRSIFKFYLTFFILGFSYNTMWNPDFLEGFQSDVPQIVALGVVGIFLIEKFIKPKLFIYPIASVIIFFMHYFLNDLVPDLPLVSFIFYGVNFSFFPWFFTFLAGVYAYKCKNINNLILSGLSFFSLIIFYLLFSPKICLRNLICPSVISFYHQRYYLSCFILLG